MDDDYSLLFAACSTAESLNGGEDNNSQDPTLLYDIIKKVFCFDSEMQRDQATYILYITVFIHHCSVKAFHKVRKTTLIIKWVLTLRFTK